MPGNRWAWKAIFLLIPVALALWAVTQILVTLRPDTIDSIGKAVDVAKDRWPLSLLNGGSVWTAIQLALVALLAYLVFWYVLAVRESVEPPAQVAQSFHASDAIDHHIDARQARYYTGILLRPQTFVSRISESVEPGARSLQVRTTLLVELLGGQAVTFVPVAQVKRGELMDSVKFYEVDRRISSLTAGQTRYLIEQVVAQTVHSWGRHARRVFNQTTASQPSLADSTARYLYMAISSIADDSSRLAEIDGMGAELAYRIAALAQGREQDAAQLAELLVNLRKSFPVFVACGPAQSGSARVTVERKYVPAQRRLNFGVVISDLGSQLSWRHLASRGMPTSVRLAVWVRRVLRAPWRTALELVRMTVDEARHLAGVSSNVLAYPLDNATRARSYHLELRGPEGTFVGRATLMSASGTAISRPARVGLEYVSSQLRGQRTAHIHISNAPVSIGENQYAASFFERTPGSMATSAAVALATLTVSLVIALTQVTHAEHACVGAVVSRICLAAPTASEDSSALLQILLAFPLTILLASPTRASSAWGAVMAARVANFCSVVLAVAALVLSSLPSFYTLGGFEVAWLVLLCAMAVNTVACLGSMLLRSSIHGALLSQSLFGFSLRR